MNDKRYSNLVLILAFVACGFVALPFALPFLNLLKIKPEANFLGFLLHLGWILGLVLALVSLILANLIKDKPAKLFVGRISSYAIGGSLFWILIFIVSLLTRGHYR